MIQLVPRTEGNLLLALLSPLLAFALTMLIGAILLAILGFEPGEVLWNFFVLSLTGSYQFAELFVKATPLILMAVGLSLGFRANVWNIGAEGQFILGAIFAALVALPLKAWPIGLLLPLTALAAIFGGMLWAAIPAFLKSRFHASELLTSLMLVYVAQQLLFYLVAGPMKDPFAFSWPKSADFPAAAQMPILAADTRFHLGFIIALVVAVIGWLALTRTSFGFYLSVAGSAPKAARFSGYSEKMALWASLLIGGGLAGLAGFIEAANNVGFLSQSLTTGLGFTAIIVAFLGRLHPLGIVVSGLLLALTYLGGETVQTFNQVPQGLTQVLQATLLFLILASDLVLRYRFVLRVSAA